MKTILCLITMLLAVSITAQIKSWEFLNPGIEDGIHDIEISQDNSVYLYTYGTGKVLKSVDKGTSWKKTAQLDSVFYEQIIFFKDTGWLVGSPNKIYFTFNGGKTWNNRAIRAEESNKLGLIYGMSFFDGRRGYIVINDKTEEGIQSKIYYTKDSGISWELINTINELLLNLEMKGNSLYASGKNVIIKNAHLNGKLEYCFKDSSGKVGLIRDICFDTNDGIMAISDNGYVVNIKNSEINIKKITKNRIRCIERINNTWLCIGDNNKEKGNMFWSHDGVEWKNDINDFPDLHRMFYSNGQLWIVGKKGFIAKGEL